MKKMKKIMALLLAGAMTMAMSFAAFADEAGTAVTAVAEAAEESEVLTVAAGAGSTGSLTVKVKDGQTLANQTVNIYKLFDMTVSGDTEQKNYGYKVNATYAPILDKVLGAGFTDKTDLGYYTAVEAATKDDKVQTFANNFTSKLLEYNRTNSPKIDATATKSFDKNSTDTSTEFTDLAYGYYLVCQTGTKAIQSSLVPVVKATGTEVDLKSEAPDITKKADKETVSIGEVVNYTITGQVPDMTGYDNYVYKVHDTLTDGLDFVTNTEGTKVAVKVEIGGAVVSEITTADFAGTDGSVSESATRTMVLDLSEKVRTATAGQEIKVTYSAKVNKNAVVETKNSATLEYSNKPGETGTGTTKPTEVVTPTYPLDVNKTNTKNVQLADAHFTLYGATATGEIDKTKVIKVTDDGNGKYSYAADQTSTAAGVITDMKTVATGIDGSGYNLHINGLAAETYYLEETQAPEGYNKLSAPIKVTITKTGDTNWTISKNDTTEDDKIIDIENSTGSLLPSTGGRGTIAFAVVAVLLVFGVTVSYIRDKKKEA